jgi:hypothetical protein
VGLVAAFLVAGPHGMTKWLSYPNLQRRPHAPNKGRGRLQVQIRRAFAIHGPVVSSSQTYDWAYARQPRLRRSLAHRHSVFRILREIAEPVGRAPTIGRPWLWRLRVPPYGAWLWRLREPIGSAIGSSESSAANKPLPEKEE